MDTSDTQGSAPVNAGGSDAGSQEQAPQKSRRELELELELERTKGDATKWKRIATRAKNQLDKGDDDGDEKPEAPQTKPDDSALLKRLEKVVLTNSGLTHPDDAELARTTAKKWGMELEDVIADEDFKAKLERQQTARANATATSNIQGGAGSSQAKNDAAYWIAKGTPPTAADVSDRKTRAKIARAMMANAKTGGKKFYND